MPNTPPSFADCFNLMKVVPGLAAIDRWTGGTNTGCNGWTLTRHAPASCPSATCPTGCRCGAGGYDFAGRNTYAGNDFCRPAFPNDCFCSKLLGNVCTCANGSPATGTACTRHGASICKACNTNYNRANTNNVWTGCTANVCTCSNGTPRTGSACTTNNAAMCALCNTGYRLTGTACAACNVAQASTYATTLSSGSRCTVATCNTGYRRATNGASCGACNVANASTYATTVTSGSRCTVANCDAGYRKATNGLSCTANVCMCGNGSPATGAACTTHSGSICKACNANYRRANDGTVWIGCTSNVCACTHGTRRSGACPTHNHSDARRVPSAIASPGPPPHSRVQRAQLKLIV